MVGTNKKLARITEAQAVAAPCERCRVPAGVKCRNYRGQNKQTCPTRGQSAEAPAPARPAADQAELF